MRVVAAGAAILLVGCDILPRTAEPTINLVVVNGSPDGVTLIVTAYSHREVAAQWHQLRNWRPIHLAA